MKTPIQKKKTAPEMPIDPNKFDMSKSPFIIKKNEAARAFLAKYPPPQDKPKKAK